jgi:hypothetical protein
MKKLIKILRKTFAIHVVSSSTEWDLKTSKMKEYVVEVEKFEKTEQRLELDKVLMQSGRQHTGDVTIYDNILSTFDKYMWKYGSTNIKIKTDKLKPQIYKVMAHEIEIVS